MSREINDNFSLDDILAEFSDRKDTSYTPAAKQNLPSSEQPAPQPRQTREAPPAPAVRRSEATEKPAKSTKDSLNDKTVRMPSVRLPKSVPDPDKQPTEKKPPRREAAAPKVEPKREAPPAPPAKPPREEKNASEPPRKKRGAFGSFTLSVIFAAVSALALVWVLVNIHPASGTVSTSAADTKLTLSKELDNYYYNAKADALDGLVYIPKKYTIPESATVFPVPNPECYGTTNDPNDILKVIDSAAALLDGQSVIFNTNSDFVPGAPLRWYLDETILVIAWQEFINGSCCTCAEVKIADGSQLRRKLAEDSYSSSVQLYASDMAKACNSVIAINGDFYAFRELGITVYQRKLYRNAPAQVDTCYFTSAGNMLFSRAGELMGEGEAERFIEDNDVIFSVAFGPILIDNGELQYCESYPIGEIDTEYSRSSISYYDELHYFLMTINHTAEGTPRANINQLARYIYTKGVQKAYTLDGGQTSEIVMQGEPINHVDFGHERTVSDIICFATALPNEEANR